MIFGIRPWEMLDVNEDEYQQMADWVKTHNAQAK